MATTSGRWPAGRSRGVTVAVDGFFAFVWFGWGQAAAPSWLVIPLTVGGAASLLLAVAGVVVAIRSPGPLPAMSDPAVRRRYSITVGLEFGLIGAGAAILGGTGNYLWAPVLVCFGVGVHFFPLATALDNPTLRPLGGLLIAVSAAALVTGLATAVAPSTVTGPGAGLSLLGFGLATLLARARPAGPHPPAPQAHHPAERSVPPTDRPAPTGRAGSSGTDEPAPG
jgi:hypothetical protein